MNKDEQEAYRNAKEYIDKYLRDGRIGGRLILAFMGLRQLPAEIGNAKTLVWLRIDNNKLANFPPEMWKLDAIEQLYVNENLLAELPAEIRRLVSLKVLGIQGNQLTTLPAEIGQLHALRELYLQGNRLTHLPPEIGKLSAMTKLHLNDNHLTTLPPDVVKLSSLKELRLENNQLAMLPPEIGQIRSLERLYLHGNPELELPPKLLGPSWESGGKPASVQSILDFYFAKREQGEAPMQEVRVLLVGRGRVGKTSLLKVLNGGRIDALEAETPGITVLPLKLQCARGLATGHAWDFGGQEFLHGTHQIFLSEHCVYVLVLEGREGNWESETDYWLRFIQSYGGESPVIVALNKYDDHKFSVDRYRLQERCPQIADFVETDALTGRGIGELRAILEKTVNGMADVWLSVPKKWHQVKEELTRMRQDFLEYRSYQMLCMRLGVAQERPQASLAEMLHRLGIALNFRDHHRLRDTSVLKPQWVTEAIYGLLRFAQDKDCHGVLRQEWIEEALAAEKYPSEKHGFVMQLMEKFEVAFVLEVSEASGAAKKPSRWLIPELLPENQPQPFTEFRAVGVKRLRFSYPEALPPGLLPRLIVRTHEMSASQPRWRAGVVLEWGKAKALVRLDRSERRTMIEVLGASQEDAQGLFDTIRAHLAVLHGQVPVVEELQVTEEPEEWVKMKELRMAERQRDEVLNVTIGKEPNDRRIGLPVGPTLDAVESPEARTAEGPMPLPRMRLFVSYAHADARQIKKLSTHLTILGRRGYIQAWDDKQLIAGEDWEERIMEELEAAEVVLLIYSSASRESAFVQDKEIPVALARAKAEKCVLIPVPLDRKDWDESVELERELKKRMTGTWNAKPVLDYKPAAKGWLEVEQAVRTAVEALRKGMR